MVLQLLNLDQRKLIAQFFATMAAVWSYIPWIRNIDPKGGEGSMNWSEIISTGSFYWILVVIAFLLFVIAFRSGKDEKRSK